MWVILLNEKTILKKYLSFWFYVNREMLSGFQNAVSVLCIAIWWTLCNFYKFFTFLNFYHEQVYFYKNILGKVQFFILFKDNFNVRFSAWRSPTSPFRICMSSRSILARADWGEGLELLILNVLSLVLVVVKTMTWGGLALCLPCTLPVVQCSWCLGEVVQFCKSSSDFLYILPLGATHLIWVPKTVTFLISVSLPLPPHFYRSPVAKPVSPGCPGWVHTGQLICTKSNLRAWALGWKSRALLTFTIELFCEKRHFLLSFLLSLLLNYLSKSQMDLCCYASVKHK